MTKRVSKYREGRATATDDRARDVARAKILQAANRRAVQLPQHRLPFGSRHIQRAVFVCRRYQLVSPEVLAAAGFNPTRKLAGR